MLIICLQSLNPEELARYEEAQQKPPRTPRKKVVKTKPVVNSAGDGNGPIFSADSDFETPNQKKKANRKTAKGGLDKESNQSPTKVDRSTDESYRSAKESEGSADESEKSTYDTEGSVVKFEAVDVREKESSDNEEGMNSDSETDNDDEDIIESPKKSPKKKSPKKSVKDMTSGSDNEIENTTISTPPLSKGTSKVPRTPTTPQNPKSPANAKAKKSKLSLQNVFGMNLPARRPANSVSSKSPFKKSLEEGANKAKSVEEGGTESPRKKKKSMNNSKTVIGDSSDGEVLFHYKKNSENAD